jgi:CheY-like chemotaxis protein
MNQATSRQVRRVLLVDDDPLVIKVYAERMRYEGWTVAIARDGWEACGEARRDRFDIILLDIRMPLHDGLDVLREIRRGEKNADTPVWVLTSLTEGDQIDDSLRLGADGVFHKSATRPDDLVAELHKIFAGEKEPVPVGAGEFEELEGIGSEFGDAFDHAFGETPEIGEDEVRAFDFSGASAAAEPDEPVRDAAEGEDEVEEEDAAGEAPKLYKVYVNPFLGEGKDLAQAVGLDASLTCPRCAGQTCMLLAVEVVAGAHDLSGQFVCTSCGEPV